MHFLLVGSYIFVVLVSIVSPGVIEAGMNHVSNTSRSKTVPFHMSKALGTKLCGTCAGGR